jgi:hypothetical protein
MPSTSEVGHAKNVSNFQDIIEFVTAYGATYNPSNNSLKLPQLIMLKTAAETHLADVIIQNIGFNNKVNERMIAFSDLKFLSTRLVNALESTDASKETIDDAREYYRPAKEYFQ